MEWLRIFVRLVFFNRHVALSHNDNESCFLHLIQTFISFFQQISIFCILKRTNHNKKVRIICFLSNSYFKNFTSNCGDVYLFESMNLCLKCNLVEIHLSRFQSFVQQIFLMERFKRYVKIRNKTDVTIFLDEFSLIRRK